jgi:hypothetical protein
MGSLTSPKSARHQVSGYMSHGFAYVTPYTLTPGLPSPGKATLLRHPFGLPTTSPVHGHSQITPKDSPATRA